MPRKLSVAAIQMDATPELTSERLARATILVAKAAASGAELVVLPECFNTGYGYTDSNYDVAETLDGTTVSWMKTQAQHHEIHLVGTLMLRDGDDVFNSALLFSPKGQMWRYDKQYPFQWERAYFREGNQQMVAETTLGKLGLMICWDSAHRKLWAQYAGKVDAIIIPSCPPRFEASELVFPDGERFNSGLKSGHFADQDMQDQAAWLSVPVVHSSGTGKFRSPMPFPKVSAVGFLLGHLSAWARIPQAAAAQLEAEYGQNTQIISATGEVVGRVLESGDSFTLAEVEVADTTYQPVSPQPKMRTAWIAYFAADVFSGLLFKFVYRRAMQRRANP
jgi:predicted amidohydrolase